ncbi:MAG TPA: T9SS type B sorting domain-containing protein, partial [Gillisia sp.]|nr:T9SS type B sorting domain-containing protein [Gillisia sp.]
KMRNLQACVLKCMKFLKQLIIIILFSIMGSGTLFAQGDRCSSIQPFCAGTSQFIFPNSNAPNGDVPIAESGPNYRCLNTQPYPAWFYLQIDNSGNLNFSISQTVNSDGTGGTLDVDFIAWGPFNEGDELCGSSALSSSRIVDCSYSPEASEDFTINNAKAGQVYVVLITNYSESRGFIRLEQTNLNQANSGTTDCSIVDILGDDIALCEDVPVILTATNVNATRYEYYVFDDSLNDFVLLSNQTSPDFTVTSSGLYRVKAINDNTGLGFNDEVLIEYFENPIAIVPQDLIGCSNGASAMFDLFEVYDEITQDPQNSGLSFDLNFYSSQANFDNDIVIENPTAFEAVNNQKIIATITYANSGCVSNSVEFNLKIEAIPEIDLEEELFFCLDINGDLQSTQSIGQDLGPGFIYNWNVPNDPDGDGVQNPILVFNEVAVTSEFSVEIINKNTGCSKVFSTNINYSSAPKDISYSISGNDFEDGYVVSVSTSDLNGTTPVYEYRLDAGPWQLQPDFSNVKPGVHTVSARDIYGCGSLTSDSFRLIGYSRFFTPNGDGYNDTWNVINDAQVSISKILIYDRFGKLLKQLDPRGRGWDGTYNGAAMPADDYWFLVYLRDKSTGVVSEFTGHFTLKL